MKNNAALAARQYYLSLCVCLSVCLSQVGRSFVETAGGIELVL